jgi:hypothetical protein
LTPNGPFKIAPALNLAICWESLYEIITQSAGNLLSFNFSGIFRDNTPKFIDYNVLFFVGLELKLDNKFYPHLLDEEKLNTHLAYYLAGLIEGDGTIIVPQTERSPKGKLNYPSIQIQFDSRDLALALVIQNTLGLGSICKYKGSNSYRLTVNSFKGLIIMVKLLNGKFKTVKIHDLHLLIDFLNNRFPDLKIVKQDLDQTPLFSSS